MAGVINSKQPYTMSTPKAGVLQQLFLLNCVLISFLSSHLGGQITIWSPQLLAQKTIYSNTAALGHAGTPKCPECGEGQQGS